MRVYRLLGESSLQMIELGYLLCWENFEMVCVLIAI